MKRLALGGLLAFVASSCHEGSEAQLLRVLLWEGRADCAQCKAQASTLESGATTVELTAQSVYTVALELKPADDVNKCIYHFASGSWQQFGGVMPREYTCYPEANQLTIEVPTVRDRYTSPPDLLRVNVEECAYEPRGCTRTLYSRTYGVTWRGGVAP
jgi:hypothetical protein